MGNWTKGRLNRAADWTKRRNAELTEINLADGRTRKIEWAGKTLRVRVRAGQLGPRLDLLPSHGSRFVSLFVFGFLSLWWLRLGGGSMGWLLQSLRAEVANPIEIAGALLATLAMSLMYVLFVSMSVRDNAWSFEPHRATRRLNVLGVPVRAWTYQVFDARGGPDTLVLRTTGSRDVAVRPSGWGSETDDNLMPLELRQLIHTYLAIPQAGLPELGTRR
jgi:hypothetical protein